MARGGPCEVTEAAVPEVGRVPEPAVMPKLRVNGTVEVSGSVVLPAAGGVLQPCTTPVRPLLRHCTTRPLPLPPPREFFFIRFPIQAIPLFHSVSNLDIASPSNPPPLHLLFRHLHSRSSPSISPPPASHSALQSPSAPLPPECIISSREFSAPLSSTPSSSILAPAALHFLAGTMAGAIKTLLVTFFLVVMAAVAVHAHNGVDHGPAAAPHAEDSAAGTLVASWMAPLLIAVAAFVASTQARF